MLHYALKDISSILDARLIGDGKQVISSVSIDSRLVTGGSNILFFALVGQNHDGHKFIPELYKIHGVRSFVVSRNDDLPKGLPQCTFILVKDTLQALQRLAAAHRNRFSYPVVGITGSNGKTIVKEWLSQLLAPDIKLVRSPKSYNSQVGVPLSILQMDDSFQLGIFEAGISMPGEIKKLEKIIAPTTGIFTNLGEAHQENFTNLEQKAREKLLLFSKAKNLIYCKDQKVIDSLVAEMNLKKRITTLSWGKDPNSNVRIISVENANGYTKVHIQHNGLNQFLNIPFSDSASIENAMHCFCYMLLSGTDQKVIIERLEKLSPVAMRLELKEGVNGCTLINDSYNSDLGSLSIALDFLLQQKQHSKRLLILSDILQSGKTPEVLYEEVARMVDDKKIEKIIGIGRDISRHSHLFDIDKEFYSDTKDFLNSFSRRQISNTAILLKGSRNFHFERISSMLEQKAHRTILEVNMNALVHNLNYFRSLTNPGVKIMAMVKAFSYGSGSYEIANLLQYHRVDYLGVAFADEGVALRDAGISLPIIVLNPSFGTYELMVEYNLEPEVYSITGLNEFVKVLQRSGVSRYPIHLKLDTGMHRLGFTDEQLDELIERLRSISSLEVKSIFSHLAASEDNIEDEFTAVQIEQFRSMSNKISSAIGYQPVRHILNSAGIERFPDAQFEMVRLGIGLYGVSAIDQEKLQNVSTLRTKIIQVKNLKPGETVGYNRKGRIISPSTIATIPIGYADGLNRKLSNGNGTFLLNGKLVHTIGNISMDTCMLDATGVSVSEGDDVVIFGKNPTIFDIARSIDTIPYEVLTSISRRVKRVYFQE